MDYPIDPFAGDCAFKRHGEWTRNMDATTNSTFACQAPIQSCAKDLFVDHMVPTSNATVFHRYSPLQYQMYGTIVVVYYLLAGCFLYYAARGHGLLHDKLFTELDMTLTHVAVLIFWLCATFGATAAISVMWAGWSDDEYFPFTWTINICTGAGLLGIMAVLWKDVLLSVLRVDRLSSNDKWNTKHVIFASMRFVDGKPLPQAIQLREELKRRGVHLKILELLPGASICEEVFTSIEQAEAFMVFGTINYGEKTDNPACTFYECQYALDRQKKIILLRMTPWEKDFEHVQARRMFGMNELALSWMDGAPMTTELVNSIVEALE